MRRTVVLGKHIKETYKIDLNLKDKVYVNKPRIICTVETLKTEEICSFDGEPYLAWPTRFYISEQEEVNVEKIIFRADLNTIFLETNKILSKESNEEEAQEKYDLAIANFNEAMIESNEALKDYCDLHNLDYEKTDCFKLFNIVYPNKNYEIYNGKLRVKEEKIGIINLKDNAFVVSKR